MNLLGYDEVMKAMRLAIHAGQHCLLIGPAGTGKSTAVRQLFQEYEGQTHFTQLSKWSDETQLFGVPNLKELRDNGRIHFDDAGILSANYLYVDEIFDASDVLLRTLLSVLEERTFTRGTFHKILPLESCIATANYSRVNELTEAVLDRFSLAVSAPTLTQDQLERLWLEATQPNAPHNSDQPKTKIQDLHATRELAKSVTISEEHASLCNLWADEMHLSPRRRARIAWLLRVHAAMNYRNTVAEEDIESVLPYCVPAGSKQAGDIEAIRTQVENRLREKEQLAFVANDPAIGTNFTGLKTLTKRMHALRELDPASPDIATQRDAKVQQLQKLHTDIARNLELI